MKRKKKTVLQRFLSKVEVQSDSCWRWMGSRNPRGYGYFQHPEKYAHRVAVVLYDGPIPAGLTVDHLCSVTHCVNPDHLDVVTMEENQRRH